MFKEIYIAGVNKAEELHNFAEAFGLNTLVPGRYSTYLLVQLYGHAIIERSSVSAHVMQAMEELESGSPQGATKPPTMFRGKALKGLWHKHYMRADVPSMATNLLNALNKYGLPSLEQKVRMVDNSGREEYFDYSDIAEIAKEAVESNYERRYDAGEMTGEWIVYAVHSGVNYYLCLATHQTGDESIRQQIELTCVPEFGFLSDMLHKI